VKSLRQLNPIVTFLFGLRGWMGRVFGWDGERTRPPQDSFVAHLTAADREASLVPPGALDGLQSTLFVSPRESISEIRNATVHAFSVLAMAQRPRGYRVYWAIYVRPVGWITSWYMGLIDPFRRLIIYPAVLREAEIRWARAQRSGPTPSCS